MRLQIAIIISLFIVIFSVLFHPVFFGGKTLFPSNLLVSAYAPWKYEPIPEYPNGPPNKPIGFDDIRQFFPNRKLLQESLASGEIPLWNPYIYAGAPFMASFDTAVWYPLSWIAALMPTLIGWNFLVIVQPVLSLWFMFLFLRSLKFNARISLFGAFAYAFSGWMVVYWQEILVLEHSFLWLPLALYASNKKRFLLLVFALTCSVFAGFLQMAVYVFLVTLAWNIYVVRSRRMLLAIALSLLLPAIQLIPSIEAFLLSPRGMEDGYKTFQNGLLPLTHLVTLLAPDFWGNPGVYNYFGGQGFYFEKMIYIGIIPLVFFLYALVSKKESSTTFWKITALISLSLGFALPTSWLPYMLRIPVLSNSYPTRIFGVFAFSAIILSCFGLRSFISLPHKRRFVWILVGLTAVLFVLWIWVGGFWLLVNRYSLAVDWCGKLIGVCQITGLSPLREIGLRYATISLRNLIIPSLFLITSWGIILIFKFGKKYFYACVFFLTVASGYYFAHKYISFSDTRFVYPELTVISKLNELAGYDRVWGFGNAFIEKNLPQYYRWFSTDGYGNLSSIRYGELMSTIASGGKLGGAVRRSDTDLFEASQRDTMQQNPYRLRLMSLLGVKYILEVKDGEKTAFTPDLFQLLWEDDHWRIWQYTRTLPRALFASRYLVGSGQTIIDALYDSSVDLGKTVILEIDPNIRPTEASGAANIVSYGLNTVTIQSTSDGPGFVVLSDNYYPGWEALVDGKKVEVYRANYSFKAVPVAGGQHTVVLQYNPKTFRIGVLISAIAIVIITVMMIV